VEDVEADVDAMARTVNLLREQSLNLGLGGCVDRTTVYLAAQAGFFDGLGHGAGQVALWLSGGGKTVFLQDANSIMVPHAKLARIVRKIKSTFPEVERVTTYGRSHTLARIPVEGLSELADAGLSRIHVGLESGSDRVLKRVKKGCTKAQHIDGGSKVMKAGIELCEYVMPGLGGADLWEEHARETADALRQIQPDHVRLRTLAARRGTPLAEEVSEGRFKLLGDEGVLGEIRLFLEEMGDTPTHLVSDHILNLLEEIEGVLPRDKPDILALIDGYFELPAEERLLFRIGRRMGMMRYLSDRKDRSRRRAARSVLDQVGDDPEEIEEVIRRLVAQFV